MSTFYTATQDARKRGFTHIMSANGKLHPLEGVTKNHTATPTTRKNGWAMANYTGIGQCLTYMQKRGKVEGFYRLANVTNGYTTRYNPLFDMFQVSHPEIGACIAEFKELEEAIDYASKG